MRILAAAALVLTVAALGLYAFRQQQAANREILSRLDDVRSSLREQSRQSAELASQVTTLSERVARLEADNRDLRRQLARLMNRKPIEVATLTLPVDAVASAKVSRPLDAIPLAPMAEHSIAVSEPILIEPVPITWQTDWSSYQPAGIIAPPAPIELQRKLTDPAFVKKMYYSFAALQATDAATTLVALNNGAREANPLMQGPVKSPPAIIAIKAGVVAGTILAMERFRKDSPVLVTAALIAINSTLAVVAVNNVSVVARQQE